MHRPQSHSPVSTKMARNTAPRGMTTRNRTKPGHTEYMSTAAYNSATKYISSAISLPLATQQPVTHAYTRYDSTSETPFRFHIPRQVSVSYHAVHVGKAPSWVLATVMYDI